MIKLLIGTALVFSSFAHAAPQTVLMKSLSYEPKVLNIKVGDSVEWKNVSYTEHSATTKDDPSAPEPFDSGMVKPKATSKKIKFTKPGSYSYHCDMHGKTMSARIVVEP